MMLSHKELIDIANRIDCSPKNTMYFSFAANFLKNNDIPADKRVEYLFNTVKQYSGKARDKSVQLALGKRSSEEKNAEADIKNWCRAFLNNPELKGRSVEELGYIMGYCERMTKINSMKRR